MDQEEYESIAGHLKMLWQVLKSNLIVSALCFFIPFVTCLYMVFSSYPLYKSTALVRMRIFTYHEMQYLISNIQILLDNQDYEVLNQKFSIEPWHLASLKKMEVERMKDKSQDCIITVFTDNPVAIKPIRRGLQNFFNNNEFVQTQLINERNSHLLLLDSLNSEIQQLSLLKEKTRNIAAISSEVFPFYQANISINLLQLNEKKATQLQKLSNTEGFTVIDGFYTPGKPDRMFLIKWIVSGLLTGLFILCITLEAILLFKNVRPSG